ncbi:MAG: helix-turn-helix transcriptional regulator [Nitrospinae bacterium]|nr:helix-turn-helix transcriptional regulator [Nitrospinota bacterium]
MDNLHEIIKGRSAPGMLIFDMDNNLLYSNKEALDMLPDLQKPPIDSLEGKPAKGEKRQNTLNEIYSLCNRLKKNANEIGTASTDLNCAVLHSDMGTCSMRASFMGNPESKSPTHIVVLLEKIILRHQTDIEKVRAEFGLSNRELEVLECISEGLSNKTISEKLFISEYTVKDHIKNIMRKMNVASRGEIIAHTR